MPRAVAGQARARAHALADAEAHDAAANYAADDRRGIDLSEHHRHRADAVPAKANYSSMEDAYDNVQHGHATHESAEMISSRSWRSTTRPSPTCGVC